VWFIIYNDKALWSGLVGVACGLGMASYSRNAMLSILTGGAVATLMDFTGRIKDGEASPALLHPDSGGHLWFIPIWIIGLAAGTFGAASWLGWV
jgi:hypothetical protein